MTENLPHLLADWPLWPMCSAPISDEQLKRLDGGLTNQCYLLDLPSGQFVLRVNGDAIKLGIDRDTEYQLHSLLAQYGLAPKIHYVSANKDYWIRDFVEGRALTTADLQQESLIEMLALLKKIHQIELPFALTEISIVEKAENYWQEILLKDKQPALIKAKQSFQAFFQANCSMQTGLCHMDPTAANWIKKSNGELYLIDWEYAGYGSPLWDIAGLLQDSNLAPEDELELLQIYGNFTLQQWRLAKAELKYIEVLWYAVQQIISHLQLESELNSLLWSLSLRH